MSADTTFFTEHSIESAPPAARRFMTATRDHLGYLPAGMARLAALGADPGLIGALRNPESGDPDRAEPLPDERMDAVRVFALRVLDTAGDVGDRAMRDFLAAGYTTQNALEVVLGIGTYTMSTLANRLT